MVATKGLHMTVAIQPDTIMRMRAIAIINPIHFPSKLHAFVLKGLMTDYLHSFDDEMDATNHYYTANIKQSSTDACPAENFLRENSRGLNQAHQFKEGVKGQGRGECYFKDKSLSGCVRKKFWI